MKPIIQKEIIKIRSLDALLTLASSVISNFITILGTALLVRQLGGEKFGQIVLLSGAASAMSVVPASGVGLYLLKNIALSPDPTSQGGLMRSAFLLSQYIAVCIGFIVIVAGSIFSPYTLQELIIVAVTLCLFTADSIYKNALIGAQQFYALAMATVIGAALSLSIQLVGAFSLGAPGFLVGVMVGTAAQAQMTRLATRTLRKAAPVPFANPFGNAVAIWKSDFIWLATFSASIVPLAHWCAAWLAVTKAGRFSDAALLAIGMQFFNMAIFIPTVMNKIILPSSIKRHSETDKRIKILHRTLTELLFYTILMLTIPLAVRIASPIIINVYKISEIQMGVIYFCIYASVLAAGAIPVSNYLISQSLMGVGLIGNAIWAAVYICAGFYFEGGAEAISKGLLVAYSLNLAFLMATIYFLGGNCDQKTNI